MSITTVFDPPLPSDSPATFNSKAFTLVGDLNDWTGEANALALDVTTKQGIASTAADTASTQAGIATGAASTATTQANNASNSASAALASANAAAASYDAFDDRYLGAKTGDPTLDNDGNALLTGALYFNTSTNRLRVYTGSVWQEGNAGSINVQTFSGTGAQTAFTLTTAPQAEENTQVFISGVYQQKNQYSISGTTLTFSTAPPAGTDNVEVVVMSVLALGVTDGTLVTYTPSGTGAVATNVQTKLREFVSVKDFGAVGDGSNEATKIQAAINYANSLGGYVEVLFEPGKIYVTGGLVPRSGVLLNLQGSTLKLRDGGLTPILFDGGAGNGDGFGVINGTLDCNQDNNNGINVVGGVWLTGWKNLRFENLTIKECYRIGLNLIGCSYVTVYDYRFEDSGLVAAHFAYALNIEKSSGTSRYISVKNVTVSNVVGFGVHFFGCEDFESSNFDFTNLTYGANLAIAITFTNAKRGTCNNVKCALVNGDNIEINGCTDLTLENYEIDQAGNRPLLTGGVAYGYNNRVRIRNFTDTNTAGSFSASLTYLTDCELEGLVLSKGVSTTTGLTLMRRNVIRNSTIGGTVSANPVFTAYIYFRLENVVFTDYTIRRYDEQVFIASGFHSPLATSAVLTLPLASIVGSTHMANKGSVAGTLKTLTRFPGSYNQGSYQTCSFLVNDFGTAANLSAVTQVNSAVTRALTIAGDAAGKSITLTNNSGVELTVSWVLDMTSFN